MRCASAHRHAFYQLGTKQSTCCLDALNTPLETGPMHQALNPMESEQPVVCSCGAVFATASTQFCANCGATRPNPPAPGTMGSMQLAPVLLAPADVQLPGGRQLSSAQAGVGSFICGAVGCTIMVFAVRMKTTWRYCTLHSCMHLHLCRAARTSWYIFLQSYIQINKPKLGCGGGAAVSVFDDI